MLLIIGMSVAFTNKANIPSNVFIDHRPSMIIAHISSTLIRSRLPGHHPAPFVRSRDSLRLLELALQQAVFHNASAIVLTGSIIAAPPPLRVCDSNFYYQMDRSTAITEAEADYCAVRDLLESTRLPYAVTPGNDLNASYSPIRLPQSMSDQLTYGYPAHFLCCLLS